MWRPWDMDSQEEQQWDNSNDASEGIPVLASDSNESVIFVAKKPLPSIQCLCTVARAATDALPTFSSSASELLYPLVSIVN